MIKRLLPFLLTLVTPSFACGPYFYAAPPTLAVYPERHAIKTLAELRAEREEDYEEDPHFAEWLEGECLSLYKDFGQRPHEDLIQQIDVLLERNRRARFQSNYAAHQANLLLELRELAAAGLTWEDAAPYLAWRSESEDGGGWLKSEPVKHWSETPEKFKERQIEWRKQYETSSTEIGGGLDAAVDAMKPNWLVQLAAHHYQYRKFEKAVEYFDRVIDEHADHPRAEVAQLMLGRVHIAWSRSLNPKTDLGKIEEHRELAESVFESYMGKYPNGRFRSDADGWLGAIYWDREEYGDALSYYLKQTVVADHPEVVWAAVNECDRCIRALTDRTPERLKDSLPYTQIAAQPDVAMRLAYHLLDKDSRTDFTEYPFRDNGDGQRPIWVGARIAPARKDARVVLRRLASEIGEQQGGISENWDERFLALYGWIATEAGDHNGAIKVTNVVDDQQLQESDDLLRVRGIAQQRAGLFEEAIESFTLLREQFPNSPLLNDIDFRLITCLRNSGQVAEAIVILCNDERMERGTNWEEHSLHFWEEFGQWLDTMLQFGEIADLELAMNDPRLSPISAEMIRNVLRSRLIARGDFEKAKEFLSKEAPGHETWPKTEKDAVWMGLHRWNEEVEELAHLHRDANEEGEPSLKAQLKLAEAAKWEDYRGYITMPSLAVMNDIYRSDYRQSELNRSENGVAVGLTPEEAHEELERRDELWHAQKAYEEVVELTPDSNLAARALEGINRCIRARAELSKYQFQRAHESGASERSKEIYQTLKTRFPDSVEAKRAVYWTIPDLEEYKWLAGDMMPTSAESILARAFGADAYSHRSDVRKFRSELAALPGELRIMTDEQLIRKIQKMRDEFLPNYTSFNLSSYMNNLDDFEAMLSVPGVSREAREFYMKQRLGKRKVGARVPGDEPLSDFLAVLDIRSDESVEAWDAWLDAYPASPKREAVMFRWATLVARQDRAHVGVEAYFWPESPVPWGYKRMRVKRNAPPNHERVSEALNRYDEEYPSGRYAADVRLLRAGLAIDEGNWRYAVRVLADLLDDENHRDLGFHAAMNLADLFEKIHDIEKRATVLYEIAEYPPAKARLAQYIDSRTMGARLKLLAPYLVETIGLEFPNLED